MRLAGIVRDSITNGIGVRDVLFFQGCSHKCRGCHNPHTWDYNGGEYHAVGDVVNLLSDSNNDITISGGEPLDQFEPLLRFVTMIRVNTKKRIWLYTGNTVDPSKYVYRTLSRYVDVIVDGKFVEELKDPNLRFRGSSNQRIIDLPKSVIQQKIVLWEECE